jgi:predicted ATPase
MGGFERRAINMRGRYSPVAILSTANKPDEPKLAMKIKSLQISNVLSFRYHDDVGNAEKLTLDDGLNIIIGENGAGKSTALEVINFLFKRVLYKQYNVNQDLYSRRDVISFDERKQILQPANNSDFSSFRLEPNWDDEDKPQVIRIELKLDDIDSKNVELLRNNIQKLNAKVGSYTGRASTGLTANQETYIIDVTLNAISKTFAVAFKGGSHDFGFEYLTDYNFYKEAIAIYNLENQDDPIGALYESFTLISSYRNYHAFEKSISLKDQHPIQQIQGIKSRDYSKSLNTSDQSEPAIFGLVRLRVAEKHFNLISGKMDEKECEEEANKLPFVIAMNKRLGVVGLECKIKLIELRTWQYSFEFFDVRRQRAIKDINSLSAGQKSIIHLVFEAYGRGDLKGGVVIIDEPEIHLHYQFQHEYVEVIRELNREQSCQYILVTHSEALINSSTINNVRRFSLNTDGYTEIKSPQLSTEQRVLIKILDNTRSTYAFFAKKVVLVEGDTDRYFFKSVIQEMVPNLDQQIALLFMGGKNGYNEWSALFKNFGLLVYCISDFDFVAQRFYASEKGKSLKTAQEVADCKVRNPDWEVKIDADYANGIYILKNGDLESYLGIKKGLTETIDFCNQKLTAFLADDTNSASVEMRNIVAKIVN